MHVLHSAIEINHLYPSLKN
uniref:Uncharacterized protein n=1 Tax=Anguilla anguilla TaxID=7936 RepID=A0A0E9UI22_ANGAN